MRRETVFVYLWKFLGFRRNGEPFYRSYFLFKTRLPKTFEEFERMMAGARREAERRMNYYGIKMRDVETFVIHRQGIGKGHTHTQFVNVFKSIGVDRHGRIRWMTAPSRSVNPEAYQIYNEYRIKRAMEKSDREEALSRLLGVQRRPRIKLGKPRSFGGRDPTPDELFDRIKLDFRNEQYDDDHIIKNIFNIDAELPSSVDKTVKIDMRKRVRMTDHKPFYTS